MFTFQKHTDVTVSLIVCLHKLWNRGPLVIAPEVSPLEDFVRVNEGLQTIVQPPCRYLILGFKEHFQLPLVCRPTQTGVGSCAGCPTRLRVVGRAGEEAWVAPPIFSCHVNAVPSGVMQ